MSKGYIIILNQKLTENLRSLAIQYDICKILVIFVKFGFKDVSKYSNSLNFSILLFHFFKISRFQIIFIKKKENKWNDEFLLLFLIKESKFVFLCFFLFLSHSFLFTHFIFLRHLRSIKINYFYFHIVDIERFFCLFFLRLYAGLFQGYHYLGIFLAYLYSTFIQWYIEGLKWSSSFLSHIVFIFVYIHRTFLIHDIFLNQDSYIFLINFNIWILVLILSPNPNNTIMVIHSNLHNYGI